MPEITPQQKKKLNRTSLFSKNKDLANLDVLGDIADNLAGLGEAELVTIKGKQGDKGEKGDKGDKGVEGKVGAQGIQGKTGDKGDKGIQGEKGVNGKDGKDGKNGRDGRDGAKGEKGEPGKDGGQTGGIRFGQSYGFQLYVNGVKKGKAQYVDLIPGSNMTITDNLVNGLHSITFASTGGGGGFSQLAATETPNSILKVFTFAGAATVQPSFIVLDGVWMKATTALGTVNWTWNGGTNQATLTIPPNDDIYAIV